MRQRPKMAHHIIRKAGKNLGPAKPCATMLWMSMFWSLAGLHSFRRMYLPDLEAISQRSSSQTGRCAAQEENSHWRVEFDADHTFPPLDEETRMRLQYLNVLILWGRTHDPARDSSASTQSKTSLRTRCPRPITGPSVNGVLFVILRRRVRRR